MALAGKVLAQVQLGTSVANIYAPTNDAVVTQIDIVAVQSDGSTQSFTLYANGTGVANQITGTIPLQPGESAYLDGRREMKGSTDTLKGKATAATSINVTVWGFEG